MGSYRLPISLLMLLAFAVSFPIRADEPSLNGLVHDGGHPLPGVLVELVSPRPVATPLPQPGRSGADGSYSLTPPGPGPWEVRVTPEPGRAFRFVAEVLESPVRLPTLDVALLDGALLREASATGWVPATPPFRTDADGHPGGFPWLVLEDAAGRPVADARILSGSPWTVVLPGGGLAAVDPTAVRRPEPGDPRPVRVPITRLRTHRLTGRIVDGATGAPLSGVPVWSSPWSPGAVTRSGPDGTFELHSLDSAPDTLVAVADDHRPSRIAAQSSSPITVPLEPRRTGIGSVVDGAGEPIGAAALRLRPVDPATGADLHATTDPDGRFRLSNPPPGRYELRVRADGFGSVTIPGVAVGPGDGTLDLGTVHLDAGSRVSGRVIDEAGEPVAEAQILATTGQRPWDDPLAVPEIETASDADGTFAVDAPAEGDRVRLRVVHEGFEPFEGSVPFSVEDGTWEIVLRAAAGMTGWLVDERGAAVAGGLVTVEVHPGRASATADTDGRFELTGLAPGPQELRASALGYRETRRADLVIEAGESLEGVEIVLGAGAAVRGRVVADDDRPVPGASIRIARRDDPGHGGFARTDPEGRFELAGLSPGHHALDATGPSGLRIQRDIELDVQSLEITLRLDGGVPLAGMTRCPGSGPIADARLALLPEDGTATPLHTRSDPDGRFRWPGVPPGRYHLFAESPGRAPFHTRIEVEDQPVEVPAICPEPGITVEGRIVGVAFEHLPDVTVETRGPGGSRITGVDHAGRFRLDDLPASVLTVILGFRGTDRRNEIQVDLSATEPGGWVAVEVGME